MTQPYPLTRRAAAIFLTLALVPLVAGAQTSIKPGWNLFPVEQDVQIGRESSVQAEQQLPILRDGQVQSYVSRIGQRLAANAGGPAFQYQFKVVNASDINAFALPGGFIYVNRGVLEQSRNEGEVAGVIAHEIAHVALRHGTHQASKAYAAQAGISILGGLLGGHVGQGAGQIINAVGGIGLNALFLKYGRDLESQADIRGSQILAASGYSPQDMINFFHTLERVDSSKKTNWLSDHPAPPDRINRIQEEARLLRVTNSPITNVAELQQIQGRLQRSGGAMTSQQIAQAATSRSQVPVQTSRQRSAGSGTISVADPSGSYASLTAASGLFRVAYPSNWQVVQREGSAAIIAPPGGVANSGGRADIVYGVIINHYNPFNNNNAFLRGGNGNMTMEQATQDLIAQIQSDSPYLRQSNSSQRVRVSNGQAFAASLRGTDPDTGVAERVTVVTRQLGDGHLVYLLFISPEQDYSRLSGVFQTMVNSMEINPNHAD